MNDTIKTILSRRSVRSYLPQQLKESDLDLIIKAGLNAPSARNEQSWHFTVIQSRKVISNLLEASREAMLNSGDENLKKYAEDENFNIFYDAPTVIVVSGDKSAIAAPLDCAAATENMLIAAESLNIGTCWIGLVSPLFKSERAEEFKRLFEIPENNELYYAVTIGYKTNENEQAAPRRENTVNFIRE
ncbi:MAG: nitroreductase family protein [bacterium]